MLQKLSRIPTKINRLLKEQASRAIYLPKLKKHLDGRKSIVFLPTIDWNTPLYQRPQHLAIELSKHVQVIYTTINYTDDNIWGVQTLHPNLIGTNLWRDALNLQPHSYIFLLSTQQLITIEEIAWIHRQGGKIIYDYVDEIHHDISGSVQMENFLTHRHQYIKESKCAELVLCVSKRLQEEMLDYYPKEKVLLVPNGVDFNHFQVKKEANTITKDMKPIVALERPIIGYYGAMANWLDYELINTTANNHPEWHFVFIGVDYNGGLKKLNQNFSNIHYLGKKEYQDLPQYGIWFDIALIPFTKGDIAKSTSPLKMYEYMAMKRPIVATEDLLECYGFEGVYISKNSLTDFEACIFKALKATQNSKILDKLNNYALQNTWQNRVNHIYAHLTDKESA